MTGASPHAASAMPAPKVPSAPTGHTGIASTLKSAFGQNFAAFEGAAPANQGTVGKISNGLNKTVAAVGLPLQLLETGFSLVTSPLAKLMPGFPAGVITAPHLGMPHAHEHPPSDFAPLPSIGATFGAGGVSVLIGGLPAARASDLGIAPTCGSFFPLFDIQTGSSNTFICGARASRMLIDSTFHCTGGEESEEVVGGMSQVASTASKVMGVAGAAIGIAGVAAGAMSAAAQGVGAESDSKSKDADTRADAETETTGAIATGAQAAADLLNLALSAMLGKDPGLPPSKGVLMFGNPTVLIGGLPLPNALAMLGMLKSLKRTKEPEEPEFTNQRARCEDPGEPVNPISGANVDEFHDYEDHGSVPLRFRRYYDSSRNEQDAPLGYGFRHNFQLELQLLRTRAIFVDGEGRKFIFRRAADGKYAGISNGFELSQPEEDRYVLRHDEFGESGFERLTKVSKHARLAYLVRAKVHSRFDYNIDGSLRRIAQTRMDVRAPVVMTLFSYDRQGHVTNIARGPTGQERTVASYTYDEAGCLSQWRDQLGANANYVFDQYRRMTRKTDRNDFSFYYEYDAEGRCVHSYGQDNIWKISLRYEPGRTLVTESDGGVWEYHYDNWGNLTRIVDPYGGSKDKVLGDDGRIVAEIDSGGRTMRWLYDDKGRHTARQDRWGNVWPPKDQAPKLPNPLAHKIAHTPLGLQWGNAVDLSHTVDADLPAVIDNLARKVLAVPEPVADEPQIRRDIAGRMVETVDVYGNRETYAYDHEGILLAFRDKDQREYRYQRVSWNLRGAETNPLGHSVQRSFTRRELVGAIVDANGNRSDYTYDHKDRITSVTRHGVLRETYVYDIGDRLIEKRDGNGDLLLSFQVGGNGLHSRRVLASQDTHYYQYDVKGRFTEASTERYTVRMAHNALDRRTLDLRDGLGISHAYRGSELSRTTYFDRFHIEYDKSHNGDTTIRTPDGGVHRIQRLADGRILIALGNGSRAVYRFDHDERCVGRVHWRAQQSENAHWVAYRYSPSGELQQTVDSAKGQTAYQYDEAHRLIGETHSGKQIRRYEYDPGGNLTATPFLPDLQYIEGNRLHSSAAGRYVYNQRNHLTEQIGPDGQTIRYRYNNLDMLVEVSWSDQAETWQAEYDGLCRRIAKTHGAARTEFYWDGDRLAAERDPDGRVRLYVYANVEAMLPFMFLDYVSSDAAPESGQAYFVFCNQVGLPERIEDASDAAVWQAKSIDAYGYIEVEPGNTIEYDLRWPGHWFDRETGLHYNRFRSYSPVLGRYLQSDPMGQAGGINLYAYVPNPLVRVDVLGLHVGKEDGHTHESNDAAGKNAESADAGKEISESEFAEKLHAMVQNDGQKIVDEGRGKTAVAVARAGTRPEDITSPFENLPANWARFKGSAERIMNVDPETSESKASFNYKITDPDAYMRTLREVYLENGIDMHNDTADLIRSHIDAHDEFPLRAGPPGVHAEVLAYNDLRGSLDLLNPEDGYVATVKTLEGQNFLSAFPACFNCKGILTQIPLKIITGVVK